MKKLLILVLAAVLMLAFAACSAAPAQAPAETKASAQTKESKEAPAASGEAAAWKIKIGDAEFAEKDFSALELKTQTLKKKDKEGNIKDHECIGYTLKSILDLAKAADYTKITAVAADGVEYELTADVAALPTTMLTIKQDGEAHKIPRLAVDGEGSKAWLKDVVKIKVQK